MTAIKRRFSAHRFKAEKLRWHSDPWVSLPQPAVPTSSCCRAVDCARRLWAQSNDVFAAIRLSCKNYVVQRPMGFSPSVIATRCQLPHQVELGIGVNPCLLLMRKVSARHVALTKGENYVSFDALNLWASKREFVTAPNRKETKNPCSLNLWGHGFVFINTAVAGSGLSPQACIFGNGVVY